MYFKKILLLSLLIIPMALCAQNRLHFSGQMDGLSSGTIKILNSNDSLLYQTEMLQGVFSFQEMLISPDVYFIEFGKSEGKLELFLTNESIFLSGYLDPSSIDKSEIEVNGGLDTKYKLFETEFKATKKQYMRDYFKSFHAATTTEEKDSLAGVYDNLGDSLSNYVADYIKLEQSPELAAYLAYKHRGPFYENAQTVYNALSSEAKNTSLAQKLNSFMEIDMLPFANGSVIEDHQLKNEKGEDVRISDLKGKITILDFWASWCGPCKVEMGKLRKMKDSWDMDQVQIVSICMDETKEEYLKGLETEQLPWTCWWEPKGFKGSKMKDKYHFNQIPYLIVLDKEQRIIAKGIRRNELNNLIKKLTEDI